jgi:hypothetical protein
MDAIHEEYRIMFEDYPYSIFEWHGKKNLNDNKCAFEVVYAGHTFFVGVYDQRFSVGLGLQSFSFAGNRVLELIPGSEYSSYGERQIGSCALWNK